MEDLINKASQEPSVPAIDPKASHMITIDGADWKPCRWEELEYSLELAADAAAHGQRVSYRKL